MNKKQLNEIMDCVRRIKKLVAVMLKKYGISIDVNIMTTENMAVVRDFRGIGGARRGLKLGIWGDDHGNPHVEARQGGSVLAKYRIFPNVGDINEKKNYLNDVEKGLVMEWLANENNLQEARKAWYEVHKNNTAANNPFDVNGNVIK
jgi:hypothetical protein